MANSNGLTEIDGNFKTEARLVASNVEENSLVFIDGAPYTVDAADAGSGILLDNTLFANPVSGSVDPQTAINTGNISTNTTDITTKEDKSFTVIGTATALTVGGKYLSTVTNTHTLADGVATGDSIVFSWSAGTIGTITGASAIVFTDKEDVLNSDVEWVFDFPIVNVILIWDGSNWEIQ